MTSTSLTVPTNRKTGANSPSPTFPSSFRDAKSWTAPDNAMEELLDEKKNPFAWVVKRFGEYLSQSPDTAPAVSAVRALTELLKHSKANTMMELELDLRKAVESLKNATNVLSVASGCELFSRFVSRTAGDLPNFDECRKVLIERGEQYIEQATTSRDKISQFAANFIRDGVTVLTHSFSRVILSILLSAHQLRRRFNVIVTETRPDQTGYMTAKALQDAKIPVTIIMDSSVAYIMDKVDLVLVGAEGIVENGGIINKVGTYQISLVASAFKKPFYVASESFKFMRVYPLNQRDISELKQDQLMKFKFQQNLSPVEVTALETVKVENPTNDYTPPQFITLLFTELGILTPSAVSDELIKLYY